MFIDPSRFSAAAISARGKSLDSIHLAIRLSTNATEVANLLDQYIVLNAWRVSAGKSRAPVPSGLAGNAVVGGFVPGGAIISAAVSSVGSLGSGGGAASAAYGASG